MGETKKKHVIARVRAELGWSQAKAAEVFGCSRIYIAKVETGEKPVTDELALAIFAETGADPDELKKNGAAVVSGHDPGDEPGDPFTREAYERWKSHPVSVDANVEDFAGAIRLLFEKAEAKGCSMATRAYLYDAFEKVCERTVGEKIWLGG